MQRLKRLLVVEDDVATAEIMAASLRREGYDIVHHADGARALELWREDKAFDLALLDLSLPGLSGLDLCAAIRADSGIPIIILTGRIEPHDVVIGLEVGADDYVRKPFDLTELKARIRALLRRVNQLGDEEVIEIAPLVIDISGGRVTKEGRELELSGTEIKLLFELAKAPNKVLSRMTLLSRVWGYDYLGDSRLVDMAIKRLRDKIEDDPTHPVLVVTVRGLGYRLNAPRSG